MKSLFPFSETGFFICPRENMKYPNLRYGNPQAMHHYAQGIPLKQLAHKLRRSERAVSDWLKGTKKVPFWVPELLRLQAMEHDHIIYQMGIQPLRKKLGIVQNTGQIVLMPIAASDNDPDTKFDAHYTNSQVTHA
jgi:hypothetical protein